LPFRSLPFSPSFGVEGHEKETDSRCRRRTKYETILKAMLERSDYYVGTATDVLEALKTLRHSHFDMILCDLKMPNMDGMSFFRGLKGEYQGDNP